MNKSDLEVLTGIRLAEAKCLLQNGFYHGAYYLCGYAVECALKACIAKNIAEFQFPDKKLAMDSHVHDLTKLMQVASLQLSHRQLAAQDGQFDIFWTVMKDWSEQLRYETTISRAMAEQLIEAAENNQSGVLKWVRSHW